MRKPHLCRGPVTRRDFLRVGALALGGLSLAELLAARGAESGPPDTSVILFWMWGGPSHLETYDLKPDAPEDYRGPFRPIKTTTPGLDVCELFPLQAKQAHRFSLIRSLHHQMSAHNDGSIELLTGKTPDRPDPTSTALSDHPDFGMVLSKVRGHRPDGLPQYVGIPRTPFMTRPTYLGLGHKGFHVGDPSAANYAPPNLVPAGGAVSLEDRRRLLGQFDSLRHELDVQGTLDGTDKFRELALRMILNSRIAEAFDLSKEEVRLRDRYGRHLWGQSCLLARRLAEAGAGVITIDALAPTLSDRYFSWDDHINPITRWDLGDAMRYRAPFMDQALSALLEDVDERGLDRKILILAVGEFGRTPKLVRASGLIGRDHWPDAQCALVAGGGLHRGQVVGATNAKGEHPKERPLKPQDLLATVYHHLGIDYRQEFKNFAGRPVLILNEGEPIRELVG
jgi:hypothetical protein